MTKQQTWSLGLADDKVLVRQGMAALILADPRVTLAFEVGTGHDMFEALKTAQPDVLIMDQSLPDIDGIAATKEVKAKYPSVNVVVITDNDNPKAIARLMEAGASSYLMKNVDVKHAGDAIQRVIDTGYYFSEEVSHAMLSELMKKSKPRPKAQEPDPLTEREVDVLVGICEELNSDEIADKLHLSPRTVEGYRRKLLDKTRAKNTAGLVLYALKYGHFDLPED